ncbi:SPOR domain-containing protein [Acidithiobacillus marinus]|nr:SPOR domain-containing protein [Acidithiobacillus marinus]
MDDSDTAISKSRRTPNKQQRLGFMLLIIVILIVLLILSFFWKSQSASHPAQEMVTGSSARSVFLTLPQHMAASASATSSAKDAPVAVAKSVIITAATHASVPVAVPAPVKPVKIAHACQQAGWYVQLGAFGKVGMAEKLRQQADQAGVKACVGTLSVNHLYRVLVGPQASKSDAGTAAMGIGKKSGQKGAYPQYWSPE